MLRFALACVLLLAPLGALAQRAQAIGSWIVSAEVDAGTKAERHVAMTTSSQASGVVAFRCHDRRASVLVGLNKREFAQAAGERIELSYSIGESTARPTAAVVLSGELAEIDEAAARALIAAAADAPSFVVHLKLLAGPPEIVLVFRPVETRRAIEGLAKACALAL